jgi:phosphoribosylformylglycinamidine (FGAM) synthase-like enzyme
MNKIKKLNAEFKKATKAQKRVMIAQDVLAQLKAKRYVAESGCWVKPNIDSAWEQKLSHHDSVQELFIEQKIESCNVCALGGLFMSCTNFASSELGDLIEEVKLSNKLNSIFSVKQLKLIESYFEENDGYFYINSQYDRIKAFCDKHPSDKKRLQLIMENIVENEGTFVPAKLKV